MAHVKQLQDEALDAIATQVGKLYPLLFNKKSQSYQLVELAETFEVWFLPAKSIVIDSNDLLHLAKPTERWHSQIHISDQPKLVARSLSLGDDPSNWSVTELSEGDLAESIDQAIYWVDENVKNDPLVHVLEIPAFYITALWLIGDLESEVFIAKLPNDSQVLERSTLYSSQDFLEALRQEQPIIGISD